mmetsp:Transcript_148894/g.361511  ORF Transcript_148894/g.361511 Transcript_148894/m.361511 type:complete len:402 (-) Transcript_148894:218-1423(-)
MMRWSQACEGHAGDEASPQVSAQQVGDEGVSNQQDDLQQEEHLVLLQLHPPPARLRPVAALRRLGDDEPVDDLGPEFHGANHGNEHERDPDDGRNHRLEDIKITPKAEEDVEQDQGQDVIYEGCRDDGLAEVVLQHTGLSQEPERDAHARWRERRACRNAIGEERPPIDDHENGASDEWQDGAEHGDTTGWKANCLRLLKVKVHTTLKDHQSHACMADKREDVWRETAVVADLSLARLLEAFLEGVETRTPATAPRQPTGVVVPLHNIVAMLHAPRLRVPVARVSMLFPTGVRLIAACTMSVHLPAVIMAALAMAESAVLAAIAVVVHEQVNVAVLLGVELGKMMPDVLSVNDHLLDIRRRLALRMPGVLASGVLAVDEPERSGAQDHARRDLQDDGGDPQ